MKKKLRFIPISKNIFIIITSIITIGTFLFSVVLYDLSWAYDIGILHLRPLAFGEEENKIWEKEWTKGQLSYHCRTFESVEDVHEAVRALEAIGVIVEELREETGVFVAPPLSVRQSFVNRFKSASPDSRVLMAASLRHFGLFIPEIRGLCFESLENWRQNPTLAFRFIDEVNDDDIITATCNKEMEIARMTNAFFSIMSQDAPQWLIQQAVYVMNQLLESCISKDSYTYKYKFNNASAFLNKFKPLLLHPQRVSILRSLANHRNDQIASFSSNILAFLDLGGTPKPTLGIVLYGAARSIAEDTKDVLSGTYEFKVKSAKNLTPAQMTQLAEQVQSAPLPYQFLEELFEEGKRAVFIAPCLTIGYIFRDMFEEVMLLKDDVGLTHVAIPLPASQEDNFRKLASGEMSPNYKEWPKDFRRAFFQMFEDHPLNILEDIDETVRVFLRCIIELKGEGIDFILFDAEPSLAGELAFERRVQNIFNILAAKPQSRILVYCDFYRFTNARIDIHYPSGSRDYSHAKALNDRLIERSIGRNLVASVIEETNHTWHRKTFFERTNNLGVFIDRYPPSRSFGLRFGETPMDNLPFGDTVETYGAAWDGVILRHQKEDEGDRFRLARPRFPTEVKPSSGGPENEPSPEWETDMPSAPYATTKVLSGVELKVRSLKHTLTQI